MKNMKRWVALLATATMVVSAFAGCGGGNSAGSSAASGSKEKVLKFGCAEYSDGMVDGCMEVNGAWNAMRYGITECLFKFDDNMVAQPQLIEKMDESEDHTTFTFTLKDGIKFSNGADMTATKVKESFTRLLTEGKDGKASPGTYLPYDTEITADDAKKTVVFKTKEPQVNLAGRLANPVMAVVDVTGTKDFNNGVIGTGPYAIESFKDKVGYEMVANKNYRVEVPYDRVSIMYMGDAKAKTNALKSGQVDLVENITQAADIAELQADSNYTVEITSGIRTGFSWLNQAEGKALSNTALRKAIIMSVDMEAVCTSKTIGGLYKAGFAALPSSIDWGYDKLTNTYKYDPEGAKKLLDDAGIKDTDGDGWRELNGKKITLSYDSYDNRLLNEFSDAYTQYIKEIGIDVKADYGTSDDQAKKKAAGNYDLSNNNWTTVGTGDPQDYLANWYSNKEDGGKSATCGYKNAEYDKIYAEFKREFDMTKRKELAVKLQQILIDDAVILVDGYYSSSMIYSKNVGKAHIATADYYWLTSDVVPAA